MNDLSMHIMDIIQNSVSAGANNVKVKVDEDICNDLLTIIVEDDGVGMASEQLSMLDDPFYTTRTSRKVGMGIPLLRQTAEQSGGSLTVTSQPGMGTVVKAVFGYSNIDRPPLGDIANSFILCVSANPDIEFILDYTVNGSRYVFDTVSVKEVLERLPFNDPSIIKTLTEMIDENINDIKSQ